MQHSQDFTSPEPRPTPSQAPPHTFPANTDFVDTIACAKRLYDGGPVYRVILTTYSFRTAEDSHYNHRYHIRSDMCHPRRQDRTGEVEPPVNVRPAPKRHSKLYPNEAPNGPMVMRSPFLAFPPLSIQHIDEIHSHDHYVVPDYSCDWELFFDAYTRFEEDEDIAGYRLQCLAIEIRLKVRGDIVLTKRWPDVLVYRDTPNPGLDQLPSAASSKEH